MTRVEKQQCGATRTLSARRLLTVAVATAFCGGVSAQQSPSDTVVFLPKVLDASLPAYAYCSKLNTLEERRRIPALNVKEGDVPRLVHLQTMIRHGARTPVHGTEHCWPGFEPSWDCEVHEDISGHNSQFSSFNFHTVYDARPWAQPLKNRCAAQQLTDEGVQQHRVTGRVVADAYLKGGISKEATKNFMSELESSLRENKSLDDLIYFRTSENQRTRLSGATLLSTMLREVASDVPSVKLTMHTMERTHETLFPNTAVCPALKRAEGIIRNEIEAIAEKAEGRMVSRRVWNTTAVFSRRSMTILDCVFTAICANNPVPSVWSVKDLDTLLSHELNVFEELWGGNNGLLSRIATVRLFNDMRTFIMQAFPNDWEKLFSNPEDLKKQIAFMKTMQSHVSGSHPFVLWSAHDTTLFPFLATFGKPMIEASAPANNRFPPYASMINMEYYSTEKEPMFRIVYNSRVLTQHVPGCPAEKELCPIRTLFDAISWATTEGAVEPCQIHDQETKRHFTPATEIRKIRKRNTLAAEA